MKKYTPEIIFLLIACIFIVSSLPKSKEQQKKYVKVQEKLEPQTPRLVWELPFDSIKIDTFNVRQNQSLSDILSKEGISALSIDRLARASKDIFDVRKIKAGNAYYLINKDSSFKPEVFIYEESAVDYIVFDLDSMLVSRGKKKIDTLSTSTAGVIHSSLWNAFIDNGSSPALAIELSDIFAWTIDFFGIQRGDEFKVLYDELYVEDKFVGIGKIHAAVMVHMNDTISAYFFNHNQQEGYFDEKGQSLRKAFLKAPLQFSRISSKFSNSRFHPVLKISRPHRGVDYAAPTGTPVYSIGEGTVVKKAYQGGGGGNYLNIKHNSVYTSQYMHLNGFAKGISVGVRVKQGQLIGYVGKTGIATGPHLDFRIYKNGAAVDPLKVKAPPVEPISEENRPIFISIKDSLKSEIDVIKAPTK